MSPAKIIPILLALAVLLAGADCEVLHEAPAATPPPPPPTPVTVRSAPVALFRSEATRETQGWRWDWEWSGAKHCLDLLGVEYEVVSPEGLKNWSGKILILPNIRNMSADTVAQIERSKAKVLATYMTSYRNEVNEPWPSNNFALGKLLGVTFQSWVGGGEAAGSVRLEKSLGGREVTLGRGLAMMVKPSEKATILGRWPGGEPAIVKSERGLFIGEDIFCPENSDSRPVLEVVATLLNQLEPGLAKMPSRLTFSELPVPPTERVQAGGRRVRVGLGTLEGETLLRAPKKLTVNGKTGPNFYRWTKGRDIEIKGEPYLEVMRLRKNGTYRWNAYRGSLRISAEGQAVNTLDFEEYLAGVVPGEVPLTFPSESLKAMAVVARTYGSTHLNRHHDFDVCDTVHCQVYGGLGKESESTNLAVRATSGEVLTFHGAPVNALFHAVCGGTTAASAEAWPGGGGTPYLASVDDGKFCSHSGRYRWKEEYTKDELADHFREALDRTRGSHFYGLSKLTRLKIEEKSQSGRVKILSIESPEGVYRVEGDAIRWLFSGGRISTAGLQSTLFELEEKGDRYIVKGGGWGHGVGMCQQGASGRAQAGQNYHEILEHYYPQTAVTASGPKEQGKRTAEKRDS